MMRRSKDPLRAAASSILCPALRPLGFRAYRARAFVRVVGDVLHYMDLQLAKYGTKEFAVNYAAMPLFPPTPHIILSTGGRVPRGDTGDGWWPSASHEDADASMVDCVARIQSVAAPFWERTSDLAILRDILLGSRNPGQLLAGACCEARLGSSDALRATARALGELQRWYAEMPGRIWCVENIAQAESLADALKAGAVQGLLDEWRHTTLSSLGVRI